MTITEVKKQKLALESKILFECSKFSRETGLEIKDIRILSNQINLVGEHSINVVSDVSICIEL